jgi:hypothetical protein
MAFALRQNPTHARNRAEAGHASRLIYKYDFFH